MLCYVVVVLVAIVVVVVDVVGCWLLVVVVGCCCWCNKVKGNSASSSTDTLEMQLLRILRATAGSVPLAQIRTQLSVEKAELNRVLYSLQAQGLVRKTSESPPVWAAVA
ncbi:unnamed protein product [Polarella glacialis]|uniref:Z-binding domain-containing protein n=1 Tax=Polarella glacialis TaxID=89957 RepID=A0A813G4R1_POLGL|nr:unnamed protein product [Polarella glacialis]